jgi:site-specific DNA-methyltransferase (adenine-specific)
MSSLPPTESMTTLALSGSILPPNFSSSLSERQSDGLRTDDFLAVLGVDEPSWLERGPTYLKFSPNTPFDEWLPFTQSLISAGKRVSWWIADALAFGDAAYGQRYAQALETDTYTYDSLRNLASISRSVEVSRRRDTVPFSHHAEVAALEPEIQEVFLARAAEEPVTRQEFREEIKEFRQTLAREKALSQPAPDPINVPRHVRVEVADARSLPLEDESVHLIVTSPPYGVGRPYAGDGDVAAGDWQAFMHDWLLEAYRVTVQNGRLALNVSLDTSKGGFRPTYAHAVTMAEMAGWEYRSSIVWIDDQLGKSTARGSMDSAAAPHIYAGAEMIALFSKGDWKRETPAASDLRHEDWLDWTNGVWQFMGETQAWEGHPAPFPFELPRRLIRLLSFPGDVVLDPFAGTGTTILAAAQLQREAIGFDRSSQYVASALRRIVKRGVAA